MIRLSTYKLGFENIPERLKGRKLPKVWDRRIIKKAPGRSPKRVIPPGAFKLPLTLHKQLGIMTSITKSVKKGITRMKVIKKSKVGLLLDILVGSVVILLNELAAFLWIRDNIKDPGTAYVVAGFATFCSTYIIGKLIAKIVK